MAESKNTDGLVSLVTKIQSDLENYRMLVKEAIGGRDENYIPIYLKGCQICELMLVLIAHNRGYKCYGYSVRLETVTTSPLAIINMDLLPVPFCSSNLTALDFHKFKSDLNIPPECIKFLRLITSTRNAAAHCVSVTKEIAMEFARAFDYFTRWFKVEHINNLELDSTFRSKVVDRFFSLEDLFSSPEPSLSSESFLHLVEKHSAILETLLSYAVTNDARTQNIESSVNEIKKNLATISEKIIDYQSLVAKQIELAQSDSERDRILHAYTDECVSRIVKTIEISHEEQSYELEKNKLIASLGRSAWGKLDETSKTFLISAKVMFNNLIKLEDSIDYSGVCLLITKALEVEINKRFCRQYLDYLYELYDDNYLEYPTSLLGANGKPLALDKFTMGSFAYILCCYVKKSDTASQLKKNKRLLINYASERIFSSLQISEIETMLSSYANQIEDIRIRFRNPAAHTNKITRCDAENCFCLVLDVERLLKKMLDSFIA